MDFLELGDFDWISSVFFFFGFLSTKAYGVAGSTIDSSVLIIPPKALFLSVFTVLDFFIIFMGC